MKRALLVTVLVVGLAGCSGDSPNVETVDEAAPVGASQEPASEPPTAEAPSADAAAKQYMEAFASDDATKMATMVELAEPGSAAHTYALHQKALAEAFRASGTPSQPQSLTVEGGSIILCAMGEQADCGTYSDFKALPNGRLESFTVNGLDIGSRLLPSGERAPVSIGGVEVELVSAYRTAQSDKLIITATATNASEGQVTLASYDADYVTAAGQQAKATAHVGLTDIQAGASTPFAVVVDAVDAGGVLSIEVFTSDFDTIGTLRIPIQ